MCKYWWWSGTPTWWGTSTLKRLEIVNHPIGTVEAIAILKLIHSNKSLEEVNMSRCSIDSEGACHLAQALCENTNWETEPVPQFIWPRRNYFFSWNNPYQHITTDTGTIWLCAPLGEKGIHKLLEAMTINSTVQHLILPKECEEYAQKFPKLSEVQSRVFSWERHIDAVWGMDGCGRSTDETQCHQLQCHNERRGL